MTVMIGVVVNGGVVIGVAVIGGVVVVDEILRCDRVSNFRLLILCLVVVAEAGIRSTP